MSTSDSTDNNTNINNNKCDTIFTFQDGDYYYNKSMDFAEDDIRALYLTISLLLSENKGIIYDEIDNIFNNSSNLDNLFDLVNNSALNENDEIFIEIYKDFTKELLQMIYNLLNLYVSYKYKSLTESEIEFENFLKYLNEFEVKNINLIKNLSQILNTIKSFIYYIKGSIKYYDKHDVTDCLNIFLKSVEFDPSFSISYNFIGYIYSTNFKEIEKSIEYYTKCINYNSKDNLALKNRGDMYANLNKFNLAIKDYENSKLIDDNDSDCYYYLGFLYFKIGKINLALEHLIYCLDLNDNDTDAHVICAFIYGHCLEDEKKFEYHKEKALLLDASLKKLFNVCERMQ
ncbi:hypothetical protein ABK040_005558 [Willaertia magna]